MVSLRAGDGFIMDASGLRHQIWESKVGDPVSCDNTSGDYIQGRDWEQKSPTGFCQQYNSKVKGQVVSGEVKI